MGNISQYICICIYMHICVHVCILCVCPCKISGSSIKKYFLFIYLNYFFLLRELFEMKEIFSTIGKAGLYWEECPQNNLKS